MAKPTTEPVEIYLGKQGKVYGPYTAEQFAALKTLPEFLTYTYVWDGREANPDWVVIQLPESAPRRGPSPPPSDPQSYPAGASLAPDDRATRRPGLQQMPVQQAAPARTYDVPTIEALCYDTRTAIAGRLAQVTDQGCELICSGDVPAFGAQSRIVINLLDSRSGKSQNVPARLSGMRRDDGTWQLRVRWEQCPDLIARGA